jgi:class 3 adenylate cyclase
MAALETITVVVVDLVGSTELASRLGPAASEESRVEYFGLLREALEGTGGREVKDTGDGIVAVFDSASAGVNFSVAAQQAFEVRNRRADPPMRIRVGMNHGDADAENGDYHGMTLIEAARLCDAAAADQILVTEVVRALVGARHEAGFEPAGELDLKGIPDPVAAFAVRWEPTVAETASATLLPRRLRRASREGYVGRHSALAKLAALSSLSAEGAQQIALLAGEPGIGKTRLATQAALVEAEVGSRILFGHCDESLRVPHGPWIDIFGHLVDQASPELLERHVARHGGQIARLAPALGSRVDDLPPPTDTDHETERYLMWGAAAGLLEEASEEAPLLLILDDVHWADGPSLALLRWIVDEVPAARLLTIATYRDAEPSSNPELAGWLADLRRAPNVTRLDLDGLSAAELGELMAEAAGVEIDAGGRELAEGLLGETGGNPFFAAEVVAHLLESGAVSAIPEEGWVRRDPGADLRLPVSVREVVAQRIERLGPSTGEALRAAAVIGRDFEVALLAATLGEDEDDLLEVLDAALAARVVAEQPARPGWFSFTHALINHTLYEDLRSTRRARLHRAVAEAIERGPWAEESRLGELAQHWGAAGGEDLTKAATYAARAGEHDLEELAPVVALGWFERALELLDSSPGPDPSLRCRALLGLGKARRQIPDKTYLDPLVEAVAIARELGDFGMMSEAALSLSRAETEINGSVDQVRVEALEGALEILPPPEASTRARLLVALAVELQFGGGAERRVALCTEALALAREGTDKRALAQVLGGYCDALQVPETRAERSRLGEEQRSLAEGLADPDLRFWAHWHLSVTAGEVADFGAVDEHLAVLWKIAEALGRPTLMHTLKVMTCARRRVAGDLKGAEELALDAAASSDNPWIVAGQMGGIRWEQGRFAEVVEAVAQMVGQPGAPSGFEAGMVNLLHAAGDEEEARLIFDRRAARGFRELPRDSSWPVNITGWAYGAHLLDARAAASEIYEILLPLEGRYVWDSANSYGPYAYYLGGLATTMEEPRAATHFERSIEISDSIPAPLYAARSRIGLARLLGPADVERSRALLEGSLALVDGLESGPIAPEAEALLADLETAGDGV